MSKTKSSPTTPSSDTEQIVRKYLAFLSDPSSAIDQDEMSRLDAALNAAVDPIDRLRIETEREAVLSAGDSYENEFIAVAREFARAENLTVRAFKQAGVPTEVLVSAKLIPGSKPTKRRVPNGTDSADVREHMAGRVGKWTAGDIAHSTGAPTYQVQNVIAAMRGDGIIERAGYRAHASGAGRPMTLHTVV